MSGKSGQRHFIVGVSGASGAIYAKRFIESLLRDPSHQVHLVATTAGLRVFADELSPVASPRSRGKSNNSHDPSAPAILGYLDLDPGQRERLHAYSCADIGAKPASGTFLFEAMIVVPCSMNTLAQVAHGLQPNLLTRAAAVTLKEGRPLLLVPRETPLGLIELRNMVQATEAGAVMLPANPGFYHHPQSTDDLVNFIVQKIFDRLRLEFPDPIRWSGDRKPKRPRTHVA